MQKGKLYILVEDGRIKAFGCYNTSESTIYTHNDIWYWVIYVGHDGGLLYSWDTECNFIYNLATPEQIERIRNIIKKGGKYTLDSNNRLSLLPVEKRSKESIIADIQRSDLSQELKEYLINKL